MIAPFNSPLVLTVHSLAQAFAGNGRLNGWTAMDEFLEYKHIAFRSGAIRETEASGKHT
jgi:hypothetical protein